MGQTHTHVITLRRITEPANLQGFEREPWIVWNSFVKIPSLVSIIMPFEVENLTRRFPVSTESHAVYTKMPHLGCCERSGSESQEFNMPSSYKYKVNTCCFWKSFWTSKFETSYRLYTSSYSSTSKRRKVTDRQSFITKFVERCT